MPLDLSKLSEALKAAITTAGINKLALAATTRNDFDRRPVSDLGFMRRRWQSRENRLGERNTNLRSAPPSHTATADGCVVKHKIECTGNSEGTFHLEAGTQVRQVEDRTIDRRPAPLKVTRALLRARRRRRSSFRRSCFGLSIVRPSGPMRPRAIPVAVIAAA